MDSNLPYNMAEPLHILPWWLSWLFWMVLLYVLFRVFIKYIAPIFKKPVKDLSSLPAFEKNGKNSILESINNVWNTFSRNKEYREGIFQLSREMKTFLEGKTGLQIEEMSALEITGRFTTAEPGKFFSSLEMLSCSRSDPSRKEFKNMCEKAKGIVRGKVKYKLRSR